jgi:hypothetical protein
MRVNRRLQRGQGMAEYGMLLILVAMLLIVLLGIVGKAPRQTLADVYCVVKYKSSDPMHAVDLTQGAGSTVDTSLGTHTPGTSTTWFNFQNQNGWLTDKTFVCIQGQVTTNDNLAAYTVLAGN